MLNLYVVELFIIGAWNNFIFIANRMIITGLILLLHMTDRNLSMTVIFQPVHTVCIGARSLYSSLSTGLAVEDAVTACLVYDRHMQRTSWYNLHTQHTAISTITHNVEAIIFCDISLYRFAAVNISGSVKFLFIKLNLRERYKLGILWKSYMQTDKEREKCVQTWQCISVP